MKYRVRNCQLGEEIKMKERIFIQGKETMTISFLLVLL